MSLDAHIGYLLSFREDYMEHAKPQCVKCGIEEKMVRNLLSALLSIEKNWWTG